MTALIDDELVEMVARAICPTAANGEPIKSRMPGAMYDARAALAVAVPVIAGKCADIADEREGAYREVATVVTTPEIRRLAIGSADGCKTVAAAIRSLTKAQP